MGRTTYDFMEKLPFFHFVSPPDLSHLYYMLGARYGNTSVMITLSLSLSLSLRTCDVVFKK